MAWFPQDGEGAGSEPQFFQRGFLSLGARIVFATHSFTRQISYAAFSRSISEALFTSFLVTSGIFSPLNLDKKTTTVTFFILYSRFFIRESGCFFAKTWLLLADFSSILISFFFSLQHAHRSNLLNSFPFAFDLWLFLLSCQISNSSHRAGRVLSSPPLHRHTHRFAQRKWNETNRSRGRWCLFF